MTNDIIYEAVKSYKTNQKNASRYYCDISLWDTTAVTDMSGLFYQDGMVIDAGPKFSLFRWNISLWDVS